MARFATAAILAAVCALAAAAPAAADGGAAQAAQPSFTPVWTIVGAGAGFGVGIWAGLTAFDDAVNSDRKVWTTAIASAAAGGVLGYLVDRRRARSRPAPVRQPTISPLEAERRVLAAAPRLGTGDFGRWLSRPHPVCC